MKSFLNPSVIGYLVHKSGLFYSMTLPSIFHAASKVIPIDPKMMEPIKTSYDDCEGTIARNSLWVFQDKGMALVQQLRVNKGNAVGGEGVVLIEVRTQLTGLEIGFLPETIHCSPAEKAQLKRILQNHGLAEQVDKPLFIKPDNAESLKPTGNIIRWRPKDGFQAVDLGLKTLAPLGPTAVARM